VAPTPSSPTVRRRWLGFELRRLRTEAGLTGQEAADRLGWKAPKLSYLERAQRPVGPLDLGRLLDLYGVPKDDRPPYEEARRDSRRKAWWEHYDEGSLPERFQLYVGLEQGAARMRAYEPQVIHGLLQTPEYAAAVQRRLAVPRAEELIDRLVQIRIARQRAVTRELDPLELRVVLDEAALRRLVGGIEVMARQLEHVVEMADLPNITIQVLPLLVGAHPAMAGSFAILNFAFGDDAGVVYIEGQSSAVYYDSTPEIEPHSLAFQQLCSLALTPGESRSFISDVLQEPARD
jgi:transcriptional regulator with XRE-family HTH domain